MSEVAIAATEKVVVRGCFGERSGLFIFIQSSQNPGCCIVVMEDLNFYLDGVTNFTFCMIGMTINAAAIGLLCRQKTTSIFVKLMISLVCYDLVYVFLSATCFSLPRLSTTFDSKIFPQNYSLPARKQTNFYFRKSEEPCGPLLDTSYANGPIGIGLHYSCIDGGTVHFRGHSLFPDSA